MPINLSDYYPASPDLSNVVLTTGNQAIGGIKNFTSPPVVNNSGIMLLNNGTGLLNNLTLSGLEDSTSVGGIFGRSGVNTRFTIGHQSIIDNGLILNIHSGSGEFSIPGLGNSRVISLLRGSAVQGYQTSYGIVFSGSSINAEGIRGFLTRSFRAPLDRRAIDTTEATLVWTDRILSGQWQTNQRLLVNGSGVLLQGEAALSNSDPFSGNRNITRVPVVGQNYGGDTISGFLNNMFFPFISATLTLNNFTIQEYGTNVGSVSFNHTLIANSEPVGTITNMQYFRNEIPLTSPITPEIGTFSSLPITLGLTANQNFPGLNVRVSINDNGNPKIISGVNTLYFQPRYYYGMSNLSTLDATLIKSTLTNSSPTFKFNPTHAFQPNGQYIYFTYPNETKEGVTAWGNLTSIFDVNTNFENLGNFSVLSDIILTGTNGKTMTYKVYRSTLLLTVQPGQQFNFSFRF